jgi:hypothetical protein
MRVFQQSKREEFKKKTVFFISAGLRMISVVVYEHEYVAYYDAEWLRK